jgi:metal-sulfur cluster biosynthetic enzyme
VGARRVEQVREALRGVVDPCSVAAATPMNIVEMGLVDRIEPDGDGIAIRLSLTSPSCMMLGQLLDQIDEHVRPVLDGRRPVVSLDDGMTWTPDRMTGAAREARESRRRVLLSLLPGPPSSTARVRS